MPSSYTPEGIDYDIAIGAYGYCLATRADMPHRRQTVPFRKEQVDQGSEVGEQSLSGWWFRSQASFHGGAGQKYLDGGETSDLRSSRFYMSRSVDVWTPGEVKPLAPLGYYESTPTCTSGLIVPADNGYFYLNDDDENLYHRNIYTDVTTLVNDLGNGSPAHSLVSDGSSYYIARDSGIYKGPLNAPSTASVKIYNTGNVLLAYVKARLMAASGRILYELDPTAAAAALPAAFYTHPSTSFVWNNFTEVPQGIYASGYTEGGGLISSVFAIDIDTSGATPVLAAPVQVVEMPYGEQIRDGGLYGYVGRYLVMVTSAGLRISLLSDGGQVEVGPVMLTPEMLRGENGGSLICGGIASKDGYIFISTNGSSPTYEDELCLLRIDLGTEVAPGHYAWASDQVSGNWSSTARSLIFDEGGAAVVQTTDGIFRSFAGSWIGGFLVTSGIRFGTSEDKVFQSVKTTGYDSNSFGGSINTFVVKDTVDWAYNPTSSTFEPQSTPSATLTVSDDWTYKTSEFVHVEFDWSMAVNTFDPRLTSYQLRALPAPKRIRVEQIPLLCFDYEKDRNGQLVGYDGRAWERLRSLEALEEQGRTVYLERLGPNFNVPASAFTDTETVVIDSVEFMQTEAPPGRGSGFGGVILVTVRKVT